MKCLKSVVPIALTLCTAAAASSAEMLPPGQVEFGTFTKPTNGQFVEVNLTSNLIGMAARFIEKQEPDVARVLNGLQLVHVNVVGVSDENRSELDKRRSQIREQLEGKGWERVVSVQEQQQDVGIYLRTANKDTVQGLVVMVADGKNQAVFVNVVGNIKPEQLALVGERLNIDPLKHFGHPANKSESVHDSDSK